MRRSTNIKVVSVTGPVTKGFDKVIRNSCTCRGCRGANTEAVTRYADSGKMERSHELTRNGERGQPCEDMNSGPGTKPHS